MKMMNLIYKITIGESADFPRPLTIIKIQIWEVLIDMQILYWQVIEK